MKLIDREHISRHNLSGFLTSGLCDRSSIKARHAAQHAIFRAEGTLLCIFKGTSCDGGCLIILSGDTAHMAGKLLLLRCGTGTGGGVGTFHIDLHYPHTTVLQSCLIQTRDAAIAVTCRSLHGIRGTADAAGEGTILNCDILSICFRILSCDTAQIGIAAEGSKLQICCDLLNGSLIDTDSSAHDSAAGAACQSRHGLDRCILHSALISSGDAAEDQSVTIQLDTAGGCTFGNGSGIDRRDSSCFLYSTALDRQTSVILRFHRTILNGSGIFCGNTPGIALTGCHISGIGTAADGMFRLADRRDTTCISFVRRYTAGTVLRIGNISRCPSGDAACISRGGTHRGSRGNHFTVLISQISMIFTDDTANLLLSADGDSGTGHDHSILRI